MECFLNWWVTARKKSEVKYGDEGSRIDFMLQAEDRPECYIEVKSVTLAEQVNGFFPDAVTLRGQKASARANECSGGGQARRVAVCGSAFSH